MIPKSTSLKYEPSSELLHIHSKWLFSGIPGVFSTKWLQCQAKSERIFEVIGLKWELDACLPYSVPTVSENSIAAVEPIRHIKDRQDPILALSFSQKSFKLPKLFPLRSEAGWTCDEHSQVPRISVQGHLTHEKKRLPRTLQSDYA